LTPEEELSVLDRRDLRRPHQRANRAVADGRLRGRRQRDRQPGRENGPERKFTRHICVPSIMLWNEPPRDHNVLHPLLFQ